MPAPSKGAADGTSVLVEELDAGYLSRSPDLEPHDHRWDGDCMLEMQQLPAKTDVEFVFTQFPDFPGLISLGIGFVLPNLSAMSMALRRCEHADSQSSFQLAGRSVAVPAREVQCVSGAIFDWPSRCS
jgi:hypothetical protein